MSERSVRDVLNLYNPADPLEKAFTIPAPWYFDKRIEELERNSVFATTPRTGRWRDASIR